MYANDGLKPYQVIRGMASLRRGELCECLHESMPMSNLSGRQTGEIKGKRVVTGAEEHFVEAVLLGSVEKMEGLALEGLRIQMGGGGRAAAAEVAEKKAEAGSKERMVLVMLVQVRDPRENYEAVGEAMIGLIEASAAGEGGSSRLDEQGLHVAGMKSVQGRSEGRDLIWSTSLREIVVSLLSIPCPTLTPFFLVIESKVEIERTGSVAKRSRDAGNPKVTSVWLRYLAQCSRFPASAKAYSLQDEIRTLGQGIRRAAQGRDRLTGSRMGAPQMPALAKN
ncbi:hypothetical protein C4D60_Mb07t23560 [Musa balbisiana]|uniref:Uncharacterized protein n=1 Tax=Musa balbisiana TaxID=52838 RepID=A0A4S8JI84_MUSBA|nr:hypothetical protein C4D60_Mb07t23560 [Musa balbisiana]